MGTAVGANIEYDVAKKKIEPAIFDFELLKKTYNISFCLRGSNSLRLLFKSRLSRKITESEETENV